MTLKASIQNKKTHAQVRNAFSLFFIRYMASKYNL